MATVLDDAKIGSMLGDVNQGLGQVRPAVNQIEQWNSLASNIKEILQMVMAKKNDQQQQGQQAQFQQTSPMVIQNPAPPMVMMQPPAQQQITVDIPMLKQKIMQFKEQLNLFPEDIKNMTLKEVGATSQDAINSFIDMYAEKIALEIKGCVKLQ